MQLSTCRGNFSFEDLSNSHISLEAIAHSLAREQRFGGHFKCETYSVADHILDGLEVLNFHDMDPHYKLAWLLHDAHEAYLKDITSPLKYHKFNYKHNFESSNIELSIEDLLAEFTVQIDGLIFDIYGTEKAELHFEGVTGGAISGINRIKDFDRMCAASEWYQIGWEFDPNYGELLDNHFCRSRGGSFGAEQFILAYENIMREINGYSPIEHDAIEDRVMATQHVNVVGVHF